MALNEDKIVVENGVAILRGVTRNDEIQMLYEWTKANNFEKYVAIDQNGQRYKAEDGMNKRIQEEYAFNPDYVAPIEEVAKQEDLSTESDGPVVCEEEDEALEEIDEPKDAYIEDDITVDEDLTEDLTETIRELEQQLEDKNLKLFEIQTKLNVCNARLAVFESKGLTLDEVVEYVKSHGYELIIKGN